MEINFEPSHTQVEFLEALDDAETTQLLFGGAAGGGKSYILCASFVIRSLRYPGTRRVLGREELKNLKATTAQTLWKVLRQFGFKKDVHYSYNKTEGEVLFYNGSSILLKQLKYEPSDPDCTFLGGLEITEAGIDEVPEVHPKVIEVLHSRCGRWLNEKYNLKPLLAMTCNPSRGFVYDKFYKPYTKGKLEDFRRFIASTLDDNFHLDEKYKQHLEKVLSANEKKRLLRGIWEFNNDPNALVKFEAIEKLYDHAKPSEFEGTYFLTCDIAFTSDKCLLTLWNGFDVLEIRELDKEGEKPEDVIREYMQEYNIQRKHVCYDATGAGNYLKNYLPGAYVFNAGARPIGKKQKEFEHLKTQTYYLLAQEIMKDNCRIRIFDDNLREELEDELLQIKTLPKEKLDGVVKMVKKEDIKKAIGRSPDILDALSMRFVYTVTTQYKRNF